jgi:hypothetical protein
MQTGGSVSTFSATNLFRGVGYVTAIYGIGGMPGSAISPLPLLATPPTSPASSRDFPVGQSSLGTGEFLYTRTPIDAAGTTRLELKYATQSSITEIVVPQALGGDTAFQLEIERFQNSPLFIPVSAGQALRLQDFQLFGVRSFTLTGIDADPNAAGPLNVDVGLKFGSAGSTPFTVTSTAVPEPSSIVLVGIAGMTLLVWRWLAGR